MRTRSELNKRMKDYEHVERRYLPDAEKEPVIIRIDGKAAHTFTHNFRKPYDYNFAEAMRRTMVYLCENIQGCVFGYTQSDEISLILQSGKEIDSQFWFNKNLQKIVSVSASLATFEFNRQFRRLVAPTMLDSKIYRECDMNRIAAYDNAIENGLMFDSRAFTIPAEDAQNYFIDRQRDCKRNAIQSFGRYYLSQKEMDKLSTSDIIETVLQSDNVDYYEETPTYIQNGYFARKAKQKSIVNEQEVIRNKWIAAMAPEFSYDDLTYLWTLD